MTAFHLMRFPTPGALTLAVADCLGDALRPEDGVRRGVMIPGGTTPVAAYHELCRRKIMASGTVTILYSDERHVSPDAPESNYGMTRPLLKSLSIPDDRVIRVHAELDLTAAAERYHRDLERFLEGGGRLSLGFLGLGQDGHTASLFTPADVERGQGHYAVAVSRDQKPDRISVTPGLLRRIERVIILVSGPDKREIVEKLIRTPHEVTAAHALRDVSDVEIWQAVKSEA